MGDAQNFARQRIYLLTCCARSCIERNWGRDKYLRTVGDAYNKQRGRQSDTHAERMVLAASVWDALTAP